MKIYLIGFMGAGKTSKGRKLAAILGFRFSDMDHIIEHEERMSVQEIFNLKGEDWFRKKEKEVLHRLGESNEDMIISTGGGVPCFHDNMEYINSTGTSVYLKMPPEAIQSRLMRSNNTERPLIKGKSPEELLEYIKIKLVEREHFYLQCSKIIQADKTPVSELAKMLISD